MKWEMLFDPRTVESGILWNMYVTLDGEEVRKTIHQKKNVCSQFAAQ